MIDSRDFNKTIDMYVAPLERQIAERDRRIEALEAALRAIFDAADHAISADDWDNRVSAAMTDDARALVAQWPQG